MRLAGTAALAFMALSGSLASATAAETPLPDAIAAPGETVVLSVHAEGAQVYECKAGTDGKLSWLFREPIATLMADGKTVGRHYAGPNWEDADGSAVTGKAVGNAPGASANDIAWLKLDVIAHRGSGVLTAHHGAADQYDGRPTRGRLRQGRRNEERALLRGLCIFAQGLSDIVLKLVLRHGRARPGHPRLSCTSFLRDAAKNVDARQRRLHGRQTTAALRRLTPIVLSFAQHIVPMGSCGQLSRLHQAVETNDQRCALDLEFGLLKAIEDFLNGQQPARAVGEDVQNEILDLVATGFGQANMGPPVQR